jgi:hypothetical protein
MSDDLGLVVGHAWPGLVIDIEELVRHDGGDSAFRLLDQILLQRLDPHLPALRELLVNAWQGGQEFIVSSIAVRGPTRTLS